MMGPQAPCRWCKERTAECHATCKRYKTYEKARSEYREQNYKERHRERSLTEHFIDRKLHSKYGR